MRNGTLHLHKIIIKGQIFWPDTGSELKANSSGCSTPHTKPLPFLASFSLNWAPKFTFNNPTLSKNVVAFNIAMKPPAAPTPFLQKHQQVTGIQLCTAIKPSHLHKPGKVFAPSEGAPSISKHAFLPPRRHLLSCITQWLSHKAQPPAEPARVAADVDAETSSGSSHTPFTTGCPSSTARHWKRLDAFGWSCAPVALRSHILRAHKPRANTAHDT